MQNQSKIEPNSTKRHARVPKSVQKRPKNTQAKKNTPRGPKNSKPDLARKRKTQAKQAQEHPKKVTQKMNYNQPAARAITRLQP